ncbi:hypothetical protein AEAC466_09785 [Asticcacaulis sp. AC466]|nr:hypothetical protein AEAC466_09785 [Asticcacaulis sp. AC466]
MAYSKYIICIMFWFSGAQVLCQLDLRAKNGADGQKKPAESIRTLRAKKPLFPKAANG